MSFLVDTSVWSELRRKAPSPRVSAWIRGVEPDELHLSVLVVGEIRMGVERLRGRDPRQAATLERWLHGLLRDCSDRILPVTREIAEEWGRLSVRRPLPAIDGLLAATARVHGLILVTRNVRDHRGLDVDLFDPFTTA